MRRYRCEGPFSYPWLQRCAGKSAEIVRRVNEAYASAQHDLPGIADAPDIASIVATTAKAVGRQSLDIPRVSDGSDRNGALQFRGVRFGPERVVVSRSFG